MSILTVIDDPSLTEGWLFLTTDHDLGDVYGDHILVSNILEAMTFDWCGLACYRIRREGRDHHHDDGLARHVVGQVRGPALLRLYSRFLLWLIAHKDYGIVQHANTMAAQDAITALTVMHQRHVDTGILMPLPERLKVKKVIADVRLKSMIEINGLSDIDMPIQWARCMAWNHFSPSPYTWTPYDNIKQHYSEFQFSHAITAVIDSIHADKVRAKHDEITALLTRHLETMILTEMGLLSEQEVIHGLV